VVSWADEEPSAWVATSAPMDRGFEEWLEAGHDLGAAEGDGDADRRSGGGLLRAEGDEQDAGRDQARAADAEEDVGDGRVGLAAIHGGLLALAAQLVRARPARGLDVRDRLRAQAVE